MTKGIVHLLNHVEHYVGACRYGFEGSREAYVQQQQAQHAAGGLSDKYIVFDDHYSKAGRVFLSSLVPQTIAGPLRPGDKVAVDLEIKGDSCVATNVTKLTCG